MLGSQGLRLPEAYSLGIQGQAHPPQQSWVPKPVLIGWPFRILCSLSALPRGQRRRSGGRPHAQVGSWLESSGRSGL